MKSYACLFEAKSIQEYILRSGRLRHIIGASELLDSLTPTLLDDVLQALGLRRETDVRFSRAAGGAVYLFTDEEAKRDAFRDLWTLTVRQYAPGLELIVAGGAGADDYQAYKDAEKQLQAARNCQPPLLPAGTPVTRYAARTGEPAVSKDNPLGLQDQATARFGRREFWRKERGGLTSRFAPGLSADAWPRNLEYDPKDPDDAAFPFLPDNRYLGLLHADGNGLGQLLLDLKKHVKAHPDAFMPLFRDFSGAVGKATLAAAQWATDKVLLLARDEPSDYGQADTDRLIPARPIVLGGDDLTILLRADLALPFARAFLTRFESASRVELEKLHADHPDVAHIVPDCLTAGGGIAFVRSNHPFHLAHALAESVARHAKDRAKQKPAGNGRIPPTLAFHRVTTACHGNYAEILGSEMAMGAQGAPIMTTLGAYSLDPEPGKLPALADLERLADLLARDDMARGPARQILTMLGQDIDDAGRRYAHWRELMGARAKGNLDRFDELMGRLCTGLAEDLPVSASGTPRRTPLGDATALLAVTRGAKPDSIRTQKEAA
jgi:hypothetical protein